jgi:hypothetical protein
MDKLMKELLITYITNDITNMILYIKLKHPKIINKNIAENLITKYTENINLKKYSDEDNMNIMKNIKKSIFTRKFNGSLNAKVDNLKFDNTRCHARTWNNGSIIKMENGDIIYGKQCCRKLKDSSNNYCLAHSKKNKHGDFNKDVSNELKTHFCKESIFSDNF